MDKDQSSLALVVQKEYVLKLLDHFEQDVLYMASDDLKTLKTIKNKIRDWNTVTEVRT